IQNNIIRNNRADDGSAIAQCNGIIRNNIICFNPGNDAVILFSGTFLNNTIYDNGTTTTLGPGFSANGGINGISGTVANNIIWQTFNSRTDFAGTPPLQNCVVKGYVGSNPTVITADPQFVDPAHGDFHLKATSPCIDAGTSVTGVAADFEGVQ